MKDIFKWEECYENEKEAIKDAKEFWLDNADFLEIEDNHLYLNEENYKEYFDFDEDNKIYLRADLLKETLELEDIMYLIETFLGKRYNVFTFWNSRYNIPYFDFKAFNEERDYEKYLWKLEKEQAKEFLEEQDEEQNIKSKAYEWDNKKTLNQ